MLVPLTLRDLQRHDTRSQFFQAGFHTYARTVWPIATKFGTITRGRGAFLWSIWRPRSQWGVAQRSLNFGTYCLRALGTRNSNQISHGDQTRWKENNFDRVDHAPGPGQKLFVTRILTRDLLAVASLLVIISSFFSVAHSKYICVWVLMHEFLNFMQPQGPTSLQRLQRSSQYCLNCVKLYSPSNGRHEKRKLLNLTNLFIYLFIYLLYGCWRT